MVAKIFTTEFSIGAAEPVLDRATRAAVRPRAHGETRAEAEQR